MNNIYCVVLLKNSRKVLIVEHNWVTTLVNCNDINYGVKRSTERKIFYSPESKQANFTLPVRDEFNGDIDGCYIGYLLKSLGKF